MHTHLFVASYCANALGSQLLLVSVVSSACISSIGFGGGVVAMVQRARDFIKLVCGNLGLGLRQLSLLYGNALQVSYSALKTDLAVACPGGLTDTDGSILKDGNSLSIRFSSRNKILVDQVEKIGRSLEIFTFRNPFETGTKSWSKVGEYFRFVGSSNLRHIVRFHQKFAEGKILRKEDVVKYYERYKGISLPFKLDGPVV